MMNVMTWEEQANSHDSFAAEAMARGNAVLAVAYLRQAAACRAMGPAQTELLAAMNAVSAILKVK